MKITKSQLKRIIKEEYDRFTEEEGLVASHQTSNPELDQVADISTDVVENGGSLLDISGALKNQGFDVRYKWEFLWLIRVLINILWATLRSLKLDRKMKSLRLVTG